MAAYQYKSLNIAIGSIELWRAYKDWCFHNGVSMKRHVGKLIEQFMASVKAEGIQCPYCRMVLPISDPIGELLDEITRLERENKKLREALVQSAIGKGA